MSGFGLFMGNYIRRGYAYRWIVLVPTVMVFALVTLYVTMQPDTYESHAVLMKPIANAQDQGARREANDIADDMFRSASERLLGNRMFAEVIEKIDPYPTLRETKGIDAAVERLRKNLRVDVNRGANTISVICSHNEGENPAETAADVVNALTDLFIKSQRDAIEDQVNKHKMFLDLEKSRIRKELETHQNLLDEFKDRHTSSLPEDIEDNRAQIDRLQRDIYDYRAQKRAFEARAATLGRDIKRLEADLVISGETGPEDITRALNSSEERLSELRLALKDALFMYAEDHENVLRLKAQIDAMEARIKELRGSSVRESAKKREDLIRYMIRENTKWQKQTIEDAKGIDRRVSETEKKIVGARRRIETAARVDAEYLSLQRNVSESMFRYEAIIKRHSEADQRARLDNYSSSVPIQVEQRAFVPAKPASPDRLVTSLMGLALGLCVGVGLAIGRHKLDRSYHRPDDLRALLPGAVLVTVPEVRKGGARVGIMVSSILGGLLLAGVFTATVALLGLQVNCQHHARHPQEGRDAVRAGHQPGRYLSEPPDPQSGMALGPGGGTDPRARDARAGPPLRTGPAHHGDHQRLGRRGQDHGHPRARGEAGFRQQARADHRPRHPSRHPEPRRGTRGSQRCTRIVHLTGGRRGLLLLSDRCPLCFHHAHGPDRPDQGSSPAESGAHREPLPARPRES